MRTRWIRSTAGSLLAGVPLLSGCAPGADAGADPAALPLLSAETPSLEIGVVEGSEEYVFADIESVVRLGDGAIAISDAGAARVSVFDREGRFVRGWGRSGDGPGEFRSLARLYPLGPDSLMAAERHSGRITVFDTEGEPGRTIAAVDVSGDSTFVLDAWLHGRFYVDGALTREARASARAALERLPTPGTPHYYRAVLVDAQGRLWIREPAEGDGTSVSVTRLEADGTASAVVRLPRAFRPTWAEGDELLGVWTGENGVHFVRAYALAEAGPPRPAPAWLLEPAAGETTGAAPDDEELADRMRTALMSMARAQEMHYSEHYSYTTRVDDLEAFEPPDDLVVDFVVGNSRGWAAVFAHPAVDRLCALGYGYNSPPGWTPGAIVCGPGGPGGPGDGA